VQVPDDNTALLLRLIGGDPDAPAGIVACAATSTSPSVLVAAAVTTQDPDLLVRAGRHATSSRDRQLVTIAAACLRGDTDLLDVLARDHLVEHPDSVLAAWIAGRTQDDHA
jgi:hypothetical protein